MNNFMARWFAASRSSLKSACSIIRFSYREGKLFFCAAVGLTLVSGVIPVAQVYVTKLFVDQAALIFSAGPQHWPLGVQLLLLQALLLVSGTVLQQWHQLVMFRWQQRLNYALEHLVNKKATEVSLLIYDSSDFYDRLRRASSGIGQRSAGFVQQLLVILQSVLTLAGYAILLIQVQGLLLLAIVIMVAPSYLLHMWGGRKKMLQFRFLSPSFRKTMYYQETMRDRQAGKEIRMFQTGPFLLSRWGQWTKTYQDEQYRLEKKIFLFRGAVDVFTACITTAIAGYMLYLGMIGRLSLGFFVSVTQAVVSSGQLFDRIAYASGEIVEDMMSFNDLFALLNEGGQDTAVSEAAAAAQETAALDGDGLDVVFERVSFQYPNSAAPALRNLSFRIANGERIAIVGENGSGKSTLARCLLGLYPVAVGTVKYNGVPLTHLPDQAIRQATTAAFQDYMKYEMTVRENIAMGHSTYDADDAIWQAARRSRADELIGELDGGLDHQLGVLFDQGRELSGGQWQKIALSRTLIREHAKLIVFDEPTASIDPKTELDIMESLLTAAEGRTTVLITHRLGCCTVVDRILVLHEGELVEEGTHAQLMARGGRYAQMYHAQTKWYKTENAPTQTLL